MTLQDSGNLLYGFVYLWKIVRQPRNILPDICCVRFVSLCSYRKVSGQFLFSRLAAASCCNAHRRCISEVSESHRLNAHGRTLHLFRVKVMMPAIGLRFFAVPRKECRLYSAEKLRSRILQRAFFPISDNLRIHCIKSAISIIGKFPVSRQTAKCLCGLIVDSDI